MMTAGCPMQPTCTIPSPTWLADQRSHFILIVAHDRGSNKDRAIVSKRQAPYVYAALACSPPGDGFKN